jgi:hypothetical protein
MTKNEHKNRYAQKAIAHHIDYRARFIFIIMCEFYSSLMHSVFAPFQRICGFQADKPIDIFISFC